MGILDVIYARAGNLKPVSPPVGRYAHMQRDTETTMAMKESLLSISGVRLAFRTQLRTVPHIAS